MANLRAIIAKAVNSGFSALGNLKVASAVLHLGRTVTVDPASDVATTAYQFNVTLLNKVARTSIDELEGVTSSVGTVQGQTVVRKQAVIIQARDLPAEVQLEPGPVEADEAMITLDGEDWNVYEVRPDAGQFTFTLLIRL